MMGSKMRIRLEKSRESADITGTRGLFQHSFQTYPIFGFFLDWSLGGKAEEGQDPWQHNPLPACEICFVCSIPAWHKEKTWAVPTLCHGAFEISTGERHLILFSRKRPQLILTLCGSAEALLVARLLTHSPRFTGRNIWNFDHFSVSCI